MISSQDNAIAIVGYAGMFPGGGGLDEFWARVAAGVDATGEVPEGRWLIDPSRILDPTIARTDKVYATRGGFVPGFDPDLAGLSIDRSLVERLDPVVHLALQVGTAAWRSARAGTVDPRRVGVILGNIVLPTETSSAFSRAVMGRPFTQALGVDGSQDGADGEPVHPWNVFPAALPAALLAQALELGGTAFTLDAACASSLYAIKLAADELRAGRADAMLTGGLSRPDPLYTQMGFSQLQALSSRGRPAPFDTLGDGLVVGEGAGVVVLRRLADAVRDGNRIHAVIRGVGLSNDVHGDLLAPSSEGQLRAMRSAYEQAGWSPADVELMECHATGTPVGDAVELASLKALWAQAGAPWSAGQCVIGSVKSNVGHMLTAAGAAGLIKLLLAMEHQILPPTANQTMPAPALGIEDSPFRILTTAERWAPRIHGRPRRAAVSGFGFGGINAHVLIEEWNPEGGGPTKTATSTAAAFKDGSRTHPPGGPVALVGLSAHFGGLDGLRSFQEQILGRACDKTRELNEFHVRVGEFRIPPREIQEMLPQQSLCLKVAAEAVRDARGTPAQGLRTGVVVGLGLDQNTNNFQLRWWLEEQARAWNRELGLDLAVDALDQWVNALRDAASPPLTANRTMGSLGGLVASRIARELRIGGPSFTVSCDEASGTQGLRLAAEWLRRGELDAVVVAAVELATDPRMALAAQLLRGIDHTGAGAAAVVLKRLDDAVRDGDRVYAVLSEPLSSGTTGPIDEPRRDLDRAVDLRITAGAREPLGDSSPGVSAAIDDDIGWTGSAAGMAAVVAAAICLYQEILPPDETKVPRYWLRNRVDGPRRAAVEVAGLAGQRHRLVLEGVEESNRFASMPVAIREIERRQPLGSSGQALFAIEADDPDGLLSRIDDLHSLASRDPDGPIEWLARAWWKQRHGDSARRLGMAVIACGAASLKQALDAACRALREGRVLDEGAVAVTSPGATIIPPSSPLESPGPLAFVYPGLGNVHAGMGRGLAVLWPDVMRRQDARNARLLDQYLPDPWWTAALPARFADHRAPILGQVAAGSLATEIFLELGVTPAAAIGYSMGESTALVALNAWTDRDDMAARLASSPLFATELAGPCDAARRTWGLAPGEAVDWVAGIVPRGGHEVEAALHGRSRVYLLIRNSAEESVIGGQSAAVRQFVEALGCPFLELPIVSTVHCEIGRSVESDYRSLHDLPTVASPGLRFYQGVTGTAYFPDRTSAGDAITAQATRPIDFPAVVERAYADGVRVFLEMGPGGSCSRLIDRILADRPHLACPVSLPERDPLENVLDVLGRLVARRIPVNLEPLYGRETMALGHRGTGSEGEIDPGRRITIKSGSRPITVPEPPVLRRPTSVPVPEPSPLPLESVTPIPSQQAPTPMHPLTGQWLAAEAARAGAHESFLRISRGYEEILARGIESQLGLIEAAARAPVTMASESHPGDAPATRQSGEPVRRESAGVFLDREQCLQFAVGSIAAVLGPEFASIDAYPTRVRLPDEPLMLVDRIVSVQGEPRSMSSGRVVTEHDILPAAWYLDAGRIPPCIAIESGQADLFLSGYLGIDFVTRGLAVYRLLDATVTFHRGLPGPGDVIRHDIRITGFFRQGETHLFRFEFDGTVNGEPLLTMRDGCAGFFSEKELAAGKGIVPMLLDTRPRPGTRPADWTELAPMAPMALDDSQVEALRRGDLQQAFGSPFDRLELEDPLPLPGGRMTLVHRVESLDPAGGRFGLGLIRAEADIRPRDWFMVCHFVDDRVMPGTLMYECCLHTLRIFLMRLGWVGARDQVAFEPLPGVGNRLRCRGQVLESTRKVTYEVTVKELGYGPEPFAIADALMCADGKPIVEFTDMALRLTGTSREELERLWARSRSADRAGSAVAPYHGKAQILAFAVGRPSDAFGERFQPFDEERFIARLPAPPYQFLDRIVTMRGTPFEMASGTSAITEYDVPPDAWYFTSDRQDRVPYAVLLEAALQPCGWVSAAMGSALTSPGPLKYRNLGGSARQHMAIDRQAGTLRTEVTVTKVTRSAGMIIQNFDFAVCRGSELVFDGSTYFGFFHPDALAQQVGVREAAPYALTPAERARGRSFALPDRSPYPDRRWRMVEHIDALVEDGGPHGLGVIAGSVEVEPSAWFFQAHFVGDPVWPGSLGLESFLQLLKVVAAERWGGEETATFDSPGFEHTHTWTYRGQILPDNRKVETLAVITERDDARRSVKADGYLLADGKVIYQMNEFTVRLARP